MKQLELLDVPSVVLVLGKHWLRRLQELQVKEDLVDGFCSMAQRGLGSAV